MNAIKKRTTAILAAAAIAASGVLPTAAAPFPVAKGAGEAASQMEKVQYAPYRGYRGKRSRGNGAGVAAAVIGALAIGGAIAVMAHQQRKREKRRARAYYGHPGPGYDAYQGGNPGGYYRGGPQYGQGYHVQQQQYGHPGYYQRGYRNY